MTSPYELVHRHVEAALADAATAAIAPETAGSALLAEAIRILKAHRSPADVKSELLFAIENLEDRDYEFMRP
jgi:hypothetical protein